MGQYRMERLNVQLRDEISQLILRGEIRDPRVTGRKSGAAARTELAPFLSVNRVEVSQDLSYAKVFVSSFASDAMLDKGVDGLNNAAGFIQSSIAKKLRIRKFPKLTFVVDSGMKDGFRMVQKLNALEQESKALEAELAETENTENDE
ncbi:MAG: 30S ribosome-binding factor RbfA [Spirochaetia bacterium]|nr:30S ribosome-binding factor RbfA [Treponema sp.]MCI6316732.1 30S ribosome-binding factor RbfA [Spirochaetia bacterium]MBQ5907581.1 30S ribosome-binding factor RbfA [Treponema sp.]MBR0545053.1 30S ribosome-binding factor RbfA [Treponema sp.]MCI6367025.1 30S ribosome-binding factor RbfA [Spirochaetia bacterium]